MYDKFCNFSLAMNSADDANEVWLGTNGTKEIKANISVQKNSYLEGEFNLSDAGYGMKDLMVYDAEVF